MDIIPKNNLIDGAYYEGFTTDGDECRVARWNAKTNLFEYALHHWEDVFMCPMTYWDETNEYYEGFQPTEATLPREFEKVENL